MRPMLEVLGRSWDVCLQSWAALGPYVGGLGPLLGRMLAVLGRSWGLCWWSWAALEAYVAALGDSWSLKWSVLGLSGRSWEGIRAGKWPWLGRESLSGGNLGQLLGLCWRSWAALGAYVAEKCQENGYLENVVISRAGARSAASGAVLGRSWTLCWRSWAAPGAYVAGLGPLLGPMFVILGPLFAILARSLGLCSRSWGLCWRSWAVWGRKVPQTRAGRRSGKETDPSCHLNAPKRPTDFFYRCILKK